MNEVSSWRLAWYWIWRTLAGALMGLLLAAIWIFFSVTVFRQSLDFPFDALNIGINLDRGKMGDYVSLFTIAIAFPVGMAIYVYCKSNFQVRVLQSILGEKDGLVQWADQSAYGAFFGGLLMVGLNQIIENPELPAIMFLLPSTTYTLVMTVYQWRVLRRYFSQAFVWFAVGLIVYTLLFFMPVIVESLEVLNSTFTSLTGIHLFRTFPTLLAEVLGLSWVSVFAILIVWPLLALLTQTFGIVWLAKVIRPREADPYSTAA